MATNSGMKKFVAEQIRDFNFVEIHWCSMHVLICTVIHVFNSIFWCKPRKFHTMEICSYTVLTKERVMSNFSYGINTKPKHIEWLNYIHFQSILLVWDYRYILET